jgi:hypothetical protein
MEKVIQFDSGMDVCIERTNKHELRYTYMYMYKNITIHRSRRMSKAQLYERFKHE